MNKQLTEQVNASLNERMKELDAAAQSYLKFREVHNVIGEDDTLPASSMKYMKEMIKDVEQLFSINLKVYSYSQNINLDDADKAAAFDIEQEDELGSAESDYQKFLTERSFEEVE